MEDKPQIASESKEIKPDLFQVSLAHLNKRTNPEVLAVLGQSETVERIPVSELDPSIRFFQTELKDTDDEVGAFVTGNLEEIDVYKGDEDSTVISVGADEAIFINAGEKVALYTTGIVSCAVFALRTRTPSGEVVLGLSHVFRPGAVERLAQLLTVAKEEGNTVEQVVYIVDDAGGDPEREDEIVSSEEVEKLCKEENQDISIVKHPYVQGFAMGLVITEAGGMAATNDLVPFRYDINEQSEYIANEKGKYGASEDHYTEVSRWEW